MPKAVATAEDPIVQEYHRTLRAVGAQSMRELDKLDPNELRKRAQAKKSAISRKPPPAVEDKDDAERTSAG